MAVIHIYKKIYLMKKVVDMINYSKSNKIYLIECFNGEEVFIKAGTTKSTLNRRFSGKMPYEWESIIEIHCPYYVSLPIESALSDKFTNYDPKKRFAGYLECFHLKDKEMVVNFIKQAVEKCQNNVSLDSCEEMIYQMV